MVTVYVTWQIDGSGPWSCASRPGWAQAMALEAHREIRREAPGEVTITEAEWLADLRAVRMELDESLWPTIAREWDLRGLPMLGADLACLAHRLSKKERT